MERPSCKAVGGFNDTDQASLTVLLATRRRAPVDAHDVAVHHERLLLSASENASLEVSGLRIGYVCAVGKTGGVCGAVSSP